MIGKPGRDIPASSAESHIAGYALAIDMTARNIQDAVKAKGLPWSTAKGFDTFTPIGPFIPASQIPFNKVGEVGLHLSVDGAVRQSGLTEGMLFPIGQLVEFVSSIMTLEEGDLILTGTPPGVGPVSPGQRIEARLTFPGLEGPVLSEVEFKCEPRQGGYEFAPASKA